MIGSQKLKDGEGRMLRAEKGRLRETDGPYGLEDCPHLTYGGTIEVRQFDEVE